MGNQITLLFSLVRMAGLPGLQAVVRTRAGSTRNIWPIQASTVFSAYKRGVGIRETALGWGLVRKDDFSLGRSFSSPPSRVVAASCVAACGVLDGGVAVGGRHRSLGPCERDGQGGGGQRRRAVVGWQLSAAHQS